MRFIVCIVLLSLFGCSETSGESGCEEVSALSGMITGAASTGTEALAGDNCDEGASGDATQPAEQAVRGFGDLTDTADKII